MLGGAPSYFEVRVALVPRQPPDVPRTAIACCR